MAFEVACITVKEPKTVMQIGKKNGYSDNYV